MNPAVIREGDVGSMEVGRELRGSVVSMFSKRVFRSCVGEAKPAIPDRTCSNSLDALSFVDSNTTSPYPLLAFDVMGIDENAYLLSYRAH